MTGLRDNNPRTEGRSTLETCHLERNVNCFHSKGKIQDVQLKLDLHAVKSYFLRGELCGHVIWRTNKYYRQMHHNYADEFRLF